MTAALTEKEKSSLQVIKEQLVEIGASEFLKGFVLGSAEERIRMRKEFEAMKEVS